MHKNILENTLCHYCGSELERTGSKKDKDWGMVHPICKRILDGGRKQRACEHPTYIQETWNAELARCPLCGKWEKVANIPEAQFTRMDVRGEPKHDGAPRFHKQTPKKP